MGPGVPIPSEVKQLGGSVTAWCWILMDSVLYSPDRDTLHGAGYVPIPSESNSWVVVLLHGVGF